MTSDTPATVGWTVEQWVSYQQALSSQDGFRAILDLVSTYDSKDPAWISIASYDQIKNQWDALPNDVVSFHPKKQQKMLTLEPPIVWCTICG